MEELNIHELERIPIPDGLEARLSAKIDEWAREETVRKHRRMANKRIAVAMAASVLLVAGVAFMLYTSRPKPSDTYTDPQMAYATAEKALLLLQQNIEKGMAQYDAMNEKGERANQILTQQLSKYE